MLFEVDTSRAGCNSNKCVFVVGDGMTGGLKKQKTGLLCCSDSKQFKIKGVLWSQALNGPLFISSAVSFIRNKKEPRILRWKYPALTTDIFNPNIFVTATSVSHTASMFLILSTLLCQGFVSESLAKREVNTVFSLQHQMQVTVLKIKTCNSLPLIDHRGKFMHV